MIQTFMEIIFLPVPKSPVKIRERNSLLSKKFYFHINKNKSFSEEFVPRDKIGSFCSLLQKTIEYQLPSGLLVIDLIDPGFMSLDTDDRDVSMAPPIDIDILIIFNLYIIEGDFRM